MRRLRHGPAGTGAWPVTGDLATRMRLDGRARHTGAVEGRCRGKGTSAYRLIEPTVQSRMQALAGLDKDEAPGR